MPIDVDENEKIHISETHTYFSAQHAERAVGYLGVAFAIRGYIPSNFPFTIFLTLWKEAVETTAEVSDRPPSPIRIPSS